MESDQRADVERNRRLFLRQLGAEGLSLVSLCQIHSRCVYRVTRTPGSEGNRQGDGLITDEEGLLLSVRTADCMPILLADPRRRAVAAIHAGWRGTLAGIVEKTVGDMRLEFGSEPEDLIAAVGPSIRACCYEVGEEVADAFRGHFVNGEEFLRRAIKPAHGLTLPISPSFLSAKPPRHDARSSIHLDLVAVALDQLLGAGLRSLKVHIADFCTSCRTDFFFSCRKEGSQTGRMIAVIGLR